MKNIYFFIFLILVCSCKKDNETKYRGTLTYTTAQIQAMLDNVHAVSFPGSGLLATTSQVGLKLNISDTSLMLSHYALTSEIPSFSMVYPSAGIALSSGSGWGSSITNNSTNWNTAYGWGNHASAGYYVGSSSSIRGLFSSTATGLTYTSGTGVFSFTSGYEIPTTTQTGNWASAYGWGNHASAGYLHVSDTAAMLAHYLRKELLTDSLTNRTGGYGSEIHYAAGDTSNYPTPDKIGDMFINTSTGKVYVSVTAARLGWRILN